MVLVRYTSWDGTQEVRLDPDEIFERLADHLSATDDLGEALDRLLREGVGGREFEVVGLDELADRVRREIQQLYDRYNLDRSLERPWNDFDDLVQMEKDALARRSPSDDRRRREEDLARLSHVLEEALAQMQRWSFEDDDARRDFERLDERSDDIVRVDRFQRRFREQFRGGESLDFEGTLELLDRFEKLRELERALRDRDFDTLEGAELGALLGEDFARAVARLGRMMRALVDAGYMVSKGGRFVLTPKGARRLGQIALREILADLLPDAGGRHDTRRTGASEVATEQVRPYRYGDSSVLDAAATVRAAVLRTASEGAGRASAAGPGPVALDARDFRVLESRRSTRTATVLLLDMSWSMSWEGRFAAAKKVALAMETLMRTRFPRDYFGIVGFYTRAVELRAADLAEVTWNMGDPFTNLQDGLRLGAELLARHPASTQQMLVVTDGQPTAYFSGGRLYCEWPMSVGGLSSRATAETLREVERVTRRGITINTFMLDDSPPLRAFVERMTAINKGRAFFTTPDQLGRFVLVDHVGKKRRVV